MLGAMNTARPNTQGAPDRASERLHTPAALSNREPLLEVLRRLLRPGDTVLELGSGSGVHVAHFAAALPEVRWHPSDPDPAMRRSIAAWIEGMDAAAPALDLDVLEPGWADAIERPVDLVLSINMLHVAPAGAVTGLLDGAARLLAPGGRVALYGPFRFNGQFCGTGNERFDAMLRQQDPAWGLRDLNDIAAQGADRGLALERVIDMPAANHVLLLRCA